MRLEVRLGGHDLGPCEVDVHRSQDMDSTWITEQDRLEADPRKAIRIVHTTTTLTVEPLTGSSRDWVGARLELLFEGDVTVELPNAKHRHLRVGQFETDLPRIIITMTSEHRTVEFPQ